ncbi:MAG TPA: hypothetical protein VM095_15350 [Pyrinomonadaceae bacterium]|nr:hypothetical protein [Pyrinomonadaceae bacterium]
MKRRLTISFIIPAVMCWAFAAHAAPLQESRSRPAPTGLALEIVFYQGKAPAYQPVSHPEAKQLGAWYALFGHLPSWQPAADSLPVKAVNILPRLEGDTVRISVSVHLGVKFFEREEPVATYNVRENETITVSELTRFGVVPFEIKLVRVNPVLTSPPPVVNNTQSLAVSGIEAFHSTLPTYKLTLQNLSGKNVAALGVEVHVNGQRRISSMPQGEDGKTVIEAGATHKLYVAAANNAQMTGDGYAPELPPNQEIIITTVVFTDGSYEGDAETAASFRAFQVGRKIQVARLVALLRQASESIDADTATALESLKTQVASLGNQAEAAAVNDLRREFPTFNRNGRVDVKASIEIALNGVKTDFLKEIQKYQRERAESKDEGNYRAWLGARKARYEKWLSNL